MEHGTSYDEATSQPLDHFIRTKPARVILGDISETTRWRWERDGILVPYQIAPGLKAYKASELRAFLESRERAVPNRARIAAALASPLHGRKGRVAQEGSPDAA